MQAKIWNYSAWIAETNPQELRSKFDSLLKKAGFNILDVSEKHFEPQGYTGLWLLSESHFALHTFPEFGKTYIELSSCNLEYYQAFLEMTKDDK
ncbi:MAG: S-adenosylmethionine decarboxylase family protein [Bacteroidales bacterium]